MVNRGSSATPALVSWCFGDLKVFVFVGRMQVVPKALLHDSDPARAGHNWMAQTPSGPEKLDVVTPS